MPSLLDREIEAVNDDSFGHRHFALALRSLVEAPTHKPPFSIGLLGAWGTGKSSIKQLYLLDLAQDQTKDPSGKVRNHRVHTITFNAWRFGGNDIKRALLRHVFLALGGDEPSLKDALFHQIQKTSKENRSWKEVGLDILENLLWVPLQVFLYLLLITLIVLLLAWTLNLTNQVVLAILELGLGTVGAAGLAHFGKHLMVPRRSSVTRIELPRTSAEEYEDLLIDQLRHFKRNGGKDCKRLVIFVDDLDRLSAEEMVSGLDAVRTFMEIPEDQLPRDLGIVFVISCDEERIARALGDRRRQLGHELPGSVFTRDDGRRFLDRIFQFRLDIPPFPRQDMRNFVLDRIKTGMPEVASDIEARGVELEELVERMIHVAVDNPRRALQILNTFASAWWIGRERERDGSGTDRPGGLHEGAVTNHPLTLGVIATLRVDFPDFYEQLKRQPDLIKQFTEVVIHDKPLTERPPVVQNMIRSYFTDSKFDEKHRPLRQYLASLQGFRWPNDLVPLLVLSEDPVTRRYGDRTRPIYDALISGDVHGLLESMGKANDSDALTHDQARLLRSMLEDLADESQERQNNAAAVVAACSARLSRDDANTLLTRVARRLVQEPELRWMIGLPAIEHVVPYADAAEKRDLAESLVNDVLVTEQTLNFRLPSGQPPSLDEAVEMARQSIGIVLEARAEVGLGTTANGRLFKWLESRNVQLEGKTYVIPFEELDSWVGAHESNLLPDFGPTYVVLLAEQLGTVETEKKLDLESALRRAEIVFTALWVSGGDDRRRLWVNLVSFAAAHSELAVTLSHTTARIHASEADATTISDLVSTLGKRMLAGTKDADWALSGPAVVTDLMSFVQGRAADLSDDALSSLATLANAWSIGAQGQEAVAILDVLQQRKSAHGASAIADWSANLLTSLVDPCLDWLAKHFDALEDGQRAPILTQLDELIAKDVISEDEGRRYRRFVQLLSPASVQLAPVQTHLQALSTSVSSHHANAGHYLERVFPVLPRLLGHLPGPVVGAMLQPLFSNTSGTPAVHAWLHGQMQKWWPKVTPELAPYDPEQIFTQGISALTQGPSDANAPLILSSLGEMVRTGVLGPKPAELISAAILLWAHHPQKALPYLQPDLQPNESQIAQLADAINPASDESIALLKAAWAQLLPGLTVAQSEVVAKTLLGQPVGGDQTDQPDRVFGLWCDVQSDRGGLLRGLLESTELNDDQRQRVWLQTQRFAEALGGDFFIQALPTVMALPDVNTLQTVFERRQTINDLFPSRDLRYALGSALLHAFATASRLDVKNQIADWLVELDASGVLKGVEDIDELTSDDLTILAGRFPDSKPIKQRRSQLDVAV